MCQESDKTLIEKIEAKKTELQNTLFSLQEQGFTTLPELIESEIDGLQFCLDLIKGQIEFGTEK